MNSVDRNLVEAADDMGDIPVTVEAVLDDRFMELSEIPDILGGAVVPCRRAAGETLDVWVEGVPFASAEIVVIEDTLALRITKILGVNRE